MFYPGFVHFVWSLTEGETFYVEGEEIYKDTNDRVADVPWAYMDPVPYDNEILDFVHLIETITGGLLEPRTGLQFEFVAAHKSKSEGGFEISEEATQRIKERSTSWPKDPWLDEVSRLEFRVVKATRE